LQSVASATTTPASRNWRPDGYGERVENSAPGSSVASVRDAARAATSPSLTYVQWSTLAASRVDSNLETGALRGQQDLSRFVDVEGSSFTKDVDPSSLRGAGVEHGTAHQVDVTLSIVHKLFGNDVGPEKRHFVSEVARHVE
jgi:hypothetical protein